ncbi:MAG: hypothetical protein AAF183_18000 [Pseudomonadota bacterium]
MITVERTILLVLLQACLWTNLGSRWLSKRIDARLSEINGGRS